MNTNEQEKTTYDWIQNEADSISEEDTKKLIETLIEEELKRNKKGKRNA